MITKQDCMTLLVRLEDNGVQGINSYLNKLLLSKKRSSNRSFTFYS